jgi:hypothetical protein
MDRNTLPEKSASRFFDVFSARNDIRSSQLPHHSHWEKIAGGYSTLCIDENGPIQFPKFGHKICSGN